MSVTRPTLKPLPLCDDEPPVEVPLPVDVPPEDAPVVVAPPEALLLLELLLLPQAASTPAVRTAMRAARPKPRILLLNRKPLS